MTTPFDNIPPEKADFIRSMAKEASTKNKNELFSFLLNINQQISNKQMDFSDEETDFLVRQLTSGLSSRDKKKVELLRQLSRMLSKRQSDTKPYDHDSP